MTYNTTTNARFGGVGIRRDGVIAASNADGTTDWLNAFNAPHWMNAFQSLQGVGGVNLINGSSGIGVSYQENYGTSWVRDLLRAYSAADARIRNAELRINGITDATLYATSNNVAYGGAPLVIRGGTDPAVYSRFGQTPHATHDVGMALDIAVVQYIDRRNQQSRSEALNPRIATLALVDPARSWSKENAVALLATLAADSPTNDQRSAIKDVLALLDVTTADVGVRDTGSIEALDTLITNASTNHAIRDGLFDDGSATGRMISQILNGSNLNNQNPYDNIFEILSRLGATHARANFHQNHFHVNIRPPEILRIGGNESHLILTNK